ncbi:MAG: serine/threonine-protein phosphatase, partial [Syntrophobacteraceae bacterium]|nr:serine/threonine-protein phosphatase [Syntrophobacteraceae bacterium]
FTWFRKKRTQPITAQKNVDTIPLYENQLADALDQIPRIAPQQLIYACGQSVGKQRDHNEDHLLAFTITIGGEGNNYPLGLFIVADGMGGHQFGEIASSTATRTMVSYILKQFLPYLTNPANNVEEPLQDLMRKAIQEAQKAVTLAAPGSGTTVTAALILGQQVTIGHVGDSRAYTIRPDGRMDPITRDHSLVKRLEELGQISSNEAVAHPQRNVLYRAVGQGEVLEADIFTAPFPQPGYLLLCSDGLWGVISDDSMFKLINKSNDLQTACQEMVDAANAAGGTDNISVIMVQLIG